MLDIQFIRDNAQLVEEKSKQKGYEVDIEKLLKLDDKRRGLIQKTDELRASLNKAAGGFKSKRPSDQERQTLKITKQQLAELEKQQNGTDHQYEQLLKQVPNMPLEDVPIGASEKDNKIVREWGDKPKFSFEPKTHWEIGESRDWIDKKRAAKVSGSRFAYLKGDLVRLQWALMQFGLSRICDENFIKEIVSDNKLKISTKPFHPVLPPLLIRTEIYDAMDRLEPRDDRYKIEGEELWLQGSAEHVLGSMHAGEIFDEKILPIRYAGFATSFRKEAGSYGKDLEGITRMHQFDKLEMESFTSPETGLSEHLLMIAIQERLMQELGLPYRVLNKCTADIGKPNARGWDIEAWLSGQKLYRETHTADYMTDYQARRLKTRVKREDKSVKFVHNVDGTALAQRPLIAIIENYQDKDGNVTIPKVLQPYMNGQDKI